ncbi:30S ribosomal protein S16 [Mycoplasma elephantis]|uniref:30S ribosomal protein S16 n=1 Tax=Mycoplasma elephantis TaxID=114882 RepID=UPI00048965BB|nr:30S ribosomal protein S16 [Mycoplasma elephantis]
MVKLRLTRGGKRFSAFYRLVAVDARQARDGQFIENLGTYDPHKKDLFVKEDRIAEWLAKGAQPSETFKNLLRSKNLWEKLHISKNTKPKKDKQAKPVKEVKTKSTSKTTKEAKPKSTTTKKSVTKKTTEKTKK